MTVKNVEKLEKNQVALTVEVSAEEFEKAIEQAYRKLRGRMNIPGFRPGKAPRAMIEKRYGAEIFYDEAVDQSFPAAYMAAIAEQDLHVVGQPTVEMVKIDRSGYTFKATVAVYPEVTLGKYKGLTATAEEVKVTAEDVKARLNELAERETRLVEVERKAKKGDIAVIDFEGFDNGVPFEGGKGENFDLTLGSGSFVPGFEEQLVGMKAGQEKDIDITFPENYTPELAGKSVVFHVKVNAVKAKEVPAMDDEFAKDVSEFETLKELKADIKRQLTADREAAAKNALEDMLLDKVAEGMEVEIPDAMIEEQIDGMMDSFKNRLKSQGLPYEEYLKYTNATEESLRAEAKAPAEKQVRLGLAMEAIVKAEKLEATDEEVDAEYEKLAAQYGMDAEELKKYIPASEVADQVCRGKAIDLVVASAKTKAPAKKAEKAEEVKEEKPAAEKKPAGKKPAGKSCAKKPAAEKTEKAEKAEKKPAAKKSSAKKAEKAE